MAIVVVATHELPLHRVIQIYNSFPKISYLRKIPFTILNNGKNKIIFSVDPKVYTQNI